MTVELKITALKLMQAYIALIENSKRRKFNEKDEEELKKVAFEMKKLIKEVENIKPININ